MDMVHDSEARREEREERQAPRPCPVSIRRREGPVPIR